MGELFGDRLKKMRKECGLTQTQLSEKLNVHLQTVSKWERNISEPDFSVLGDLADALQITLEKLLGCEENDEFYRGNFDAVLFGKAISYARKGKGESQENLAEQLGVSADTVSKWERGVVCPNIDQLKGLCENFGMSVSKLYFGITGEQETQTVQQVQRRKKFSLLSLLAAVIFCAGVVFLSVYLTNLNTDVEKPVYTVSVDGQEYEVEESGWFSPPVPQREGYDFIWFEGADHTVVQFPQKITEDASYNAVFEPHEYTIDYWLNGGGFQNDAVGSFTVESGVVELSEPVKSGATFEGWFFASDYSGESVQRISCDCDDIVLYAKWSNTVYTVRYELNGGTLSQENPTEVVAGEEITLAEPLRGGYNFLGWYDAPQGGNCYETVGGANAKNLTLYALWQESGAQYTILYDACGGNLLGENPMFIGAGELHKLFGAQKTGYDFVGWNEQADGSGKFYSVLYGLREDIKLYAIYTPKTYTLIYELDGGTFYEGVNPNKILYGETVSLFPVAKMGYTFLGWFDAKEGGSQVQQIDYSNILRLQTLYARFEPDRYRVVLDGAGGVFDFGEGQISWYELTLSFGDSLSLPNCTLSGYDFIGWFDENGKQLEKITVENIGDMVLTAHYRQAGLTYTVIYELSGGIQSSKNPSQVGYGQVVQLYVPSREGYLFLGWNDRADGSGNYYDSTQKDWESDRTLYAIWQEITVSGSYDEFEYEKGHESVTITGYSGPKGLNVDLVIPSYIEGLPVVSIGGFTSDFNHKSELHSLTIPNTVRKIADNAFRRFFIEEAVVIPSSVEELGISCFSNSDLTLYFEKGSLLSSIGAGAFEFVRFYNIVQLPENLRRLEEGAFYGAELPGIVLPDSLEYISYHSLATCFENTSDYGCRIYIPKSVKYIEAYAFNKLDHIYTALTYKQTEEFDKNWNKASEGYNMPVVTFIDEYIDGITLRYDGYTEFISGQVFALPSLQKDGYTFLGWYDEETDFVNPYYIPLRKGVILEAVFEKQSDSDGRSTFTPALLQSGEEYEFIIPPGQGFYFTPATTAKRIRITLEIEILDSPWGDFILYVYREDDPSHVISGQIMNHTAGDIYWTQTLCGWTSHFRIKILIEDVGW